MAKEFLSEGIIEDVSAGNPDFSGIEYYYKIRLKDGTFAYFMHSNFYDKHAKAPLSRASREFNNESYFRDEVLVSWAEFQGKKIITNIDFLKGGNKSPLQQSTKDWKHLPKK